MFDDISFLVQETLNDAEKGHRKKFLSHFFGQDQLPESSGVLYHVEQKISTFVIRVFPTKNLREDHKNVIKHSNLYPGLRLDREAIENGRLKYYECDNFKLAESLKLNLANKRFPLFEENVFNVSDPGDSWWMSDEGDCLKIYFKLSRTESLNKLVKLGPLGDGKHYEEMFMSLRGYFQKLFPLKDFSSGHGQISLRAEDRHHPIFKSIVHLMKYGEVSPDLFQFLMKWEVSTEAQSYLSDLQKANYNLIELATLRGFWLQVQGQLKHPVQ